MSRCVMRWDDLSDATYLLYKKIDRSYDAVVGINRGGLPLSVALSYKLSVPHAVVDVSYKNEATKVIDTDEDPNKYLKLSDHIANKEAVDSAENVLLVDDDCDSGYLLSETTKWLGSKFSNVKIIDTAVLFYWENEIYTPTYFYEKPDCQYIIHPWDKKGS